MSKKRTYKPKFVPGSCKGASEHEIWGVDSFTVFSVIAYYKKKPYGG